MLLLKFKIATEVNVHVQGVSAIKEDNESKREEKENEKPQKNVEKPKKEAKKEDKK